jgi:hypothetical protein
MSNIVSIPLPPADEVPPVYAETLEWVAAVRIIEAALVEFSDSLSRDDAMALERAWGRIQQG